MYKSSALYGSRSMPSFSLRRLFFMACFILVCHCSLFGQRIGIQSPLLALQASPGELPTSFEVVSIRRNLHPSRWRLQFRVDGFIAEGVTLRDLIEEAYGIYNSDRILGGPIWIETDRFDINARVDISLGKRLYDLNVDQRRLMLQSLLANRFGIVLHRSTQERSVSALEVAKGGAHLRSVRPEDVYRNEATHSEGIVTSSSRGQVTVEGFSMDAFARFLSVNLGTVVLNRTGLSGYYSFSLHWTPQSANLGNPYSAMPEDPPELPVGTALEKELGLKLVQARGPVEVLTIDKARAPTIG